ncbi:hypothetical protein ACIQPQ_31355 [Streptomyces sp. NPDC091281]|uniref:hypothetical protein n=1 Tax=Streptomyces sp. NPDC091281 TaxID=3365985 RepID=UPI0038287639
MSPFISNADLAVTDLGRRVRATTNVADLFGSEFDRALYRETVYSVPDSERSTCPNHLDWVADCAHLHLRAA